MEAKESKTVWEPKIALVTGGNKGIGIEIVRLLAKSGITVFLGARNKDLGEAATRSLAADKLDVRFVQLDVTKTASIEAARDHIVKAAGSLDLLVNNAGILVKTFETGFADQLRETYETNVLGPVAMIEAFLPLLKAATAKPPRIINVSSGLGSLESNGPKRALAWSPTFAVLAYANSKTALNGLSLGMNLYLEHRKHDVVIVSVNPGFTSTDMNGNTGIQTPQFAASVVTKYATGFGDGRELAGGFYDDMGKVSW